MLNKDHKKEGKGEEKRKEEKLLGSKEEWKSGKEKTAELAAELEEATMALTIELEDIASDIDENHHHANVAPHELEYLSGKPRKARPGPKKQEHEKKKKEKRKRKVNKHRKNGAKAVKPKPNSDMKVRLDDLAASKAKKERNVMKPDTAAKNIPKGGKARKL